MKKIIIHTGFHPEVPREYKGEHIYKVVATKTLGGDGTAVLNANGAVIEDAGQNVFKAALHAAHLRFRPILMTSLAFILGILPMVIAHGPGAASRQSIGTGLFFGMIMAVIVGIVLIPFFFVMIYNVQNKLQRKKVK